MDDIERRKRGFSQYQAMIKSEIGKEKEPVPEKEPNQVIQDKVSESDSVKEVPVSSDNIRKERASKGRKPRKSVKESQGFQFRVDRKIAKLLSYIKFVALSNGEDPVNLTNSNILYSALTEYIRKHYSGVSVSFSDILGEKEG